MPANVNQGGPSWGWKPSRHAVHWVAAHRVVSTIVKTIRICPQRILVALNSLPLDRSIGAGVKAEFVTRPAMRDPRRTTDARDVIAVSVISPKRQRDVEVELRRSTLAIRHHNAWWNLRRRHRLTVARWRLRSRLGYPDIARRLVDGLGILCGRRRCGHNDEYHQKCSLGCDTHYTPSRTKRLRAAKRDSWCGYGASAPPPWDQCPRALVNVVEGCLGQDLSQRHAARQGRASGDHGCNDEGVEASGCPPADGLGD